MLESADDLQELQALFDRSRDAAGRHLRGIFGHEQQPTAQETTGTLDGIFEMHLAATTSNGAPHVAPLDGIFYKGRVWFGMPAGAVRAPWYVGIRGLVPLVRLGDLRVHRPRHRDRGTSEDARWAGFESLMRELYVARYGPGWIDWHERQRASSASDGFAGLIEPRAFFVKR